MMRGGIVTEIPQAAETAGNIPSLRLVFDRHFPDHGRLFQMI